MGVWRDILVWLVVFVLIVLAVRKDLKGEK